MMQAHKRQKRLYKCTTQYNTEQKNWPGKHMHAVAQLVEALRC
jgi:hypothetical protein